MDSLTTLKLPAILALDPGGTTGWKLWDSAKPNIAPSITCGHIEGKDHHKALFDFLVMVYETRIAHELHIVCERFEFRQSDQHRHKIEYISRAYEGVVELFVQMFKGVKLVKQSGSQVKGRRDEKTDTYRGAFWSDDEKIKKVGLWVPNRRHAMDATRHYLYYRVFTLGDQELLLKLK